MSDPAASAGEELVDVIDETGEVVDVRPRRDIRAHNLLHRSVFVAVVDATGAVVVHQRADWKDVWPSRWDVCFGGVVDRGEEIRAAAVRELAEEAGVEVSPDELEWWAEELYADDLVREVGTVFLARCDGPFTFPDGEVAASDRVPLTELDAWLDAHELVPDSLALAVPHLRRLAGAGGGRS